MPVFTSSILNALRLLKLVVACWSIR